MRRPRLLLRDLHHYPDQRGGQVKVNLFLQANDMGANGGNECLLFGLKQDTQHTDSVQTHFRRDAPAHPLIDEDESGGLLQGQEDGLDLAGIKALALQLGEPISIMHGLGQKERKSGKIEGWKAPLCAAQFRRDQVGNINEIVEFLQDRNETEVLQGAKRRRITDDNRQGHFPARLKCSRDRMS